MLVTVMLKAENETLTPTRRVESLIPSVVVDESRRTLVAELFIRCTERLFRWPEINWWTPRE